MLQSLHLSQKRGLLVVAALMLSFAAYKWHQFRSKPTEPATALTVAMATEPAEEGKIELNSADSLALLDVPGIGPVIASRIIRFRKLNGGFAKLEDLLQITGIRNGNFVAMQERLYVDPSSAALQELKEAAAQNRTERKSHWSSTRKEKPNFHKQPLPSYPSEAKADLNGLAQSAVKVEAPIQTKIKSSTPIDINEADSTTLVSIAGIGPSTARNIVKYRNLIFFFHSLDQLEEVWGIRPENLERMRPQLKVGNYKERLPKLKINEMNVEELAKHKYVDFKSARILVAYRDLHGKFENMEALLKVKGLPEGMLARLEPYLVY